jgi:predicted secreted protein
VDEAVVANAGGHFTVELDEPAGAGYSWTPVALPAGVQLEGDEVVPGEALVGGVRRHVFRFAATQAGHLQLDFELRRPWEEQAADSRQVQVRVGPEG